MAKSDVNTGDVVGCNPERRRDGNALVINDPMERVGGVLDLGDEVGDVNAAGIGEREEDAGGATPRSFSNAPYHFPSLSHPSRSPRYPGAPEGGA